METVTDRVLEGKRVACTGRLAAMTRAEAADLIRNHGGTLVDSVARDTDILVIGQEGWPLRKDGRLSQKLQRARRLQRCGATITILSEEELLVRLRLEPSSNEVHRLYTIGKLTQILGVPRDRIRAWVRHGLVKPVRTEFGVAYFDFHQMCGVRTLCELAASGVTLHRLQKSLRQLGKWLGNVDQPLAQLAVLERDGRLLLRCDDGELAEPTGQLNFDFSAEPTQATVSGPERQSADEHFERAIQYEQEGRLQEASESYHRVLSLDAPNAVICFNLANTLYGLGQKEAAAERLRQAVELDQHFVEAWNNLGSVLSELGEYEQAVKAFKSALELNPHYADAHYNLADTLDDWGQPARSLMHWRQYLRLEQRGPWADYARKRLGRSG